MFTVVLDYLACHVEAAVEPVVEALCRELGTSKRLGRGMHGYSHCAELVVGDDVWVRVFYSIAGTPWLQAPGAYAQPTEDAIRACGFQYRVTRKDAALDLYDAEWFPVLVTASKQYASASDPPLNVEHAGDWQYAQKGRTLYVGSRRSRSFLRLYEKGRKERADPNWIRAEVQYNPQNETEQRAAAQMTAGQIWTLRAYPAWGKATGIEAADVFGYPARHPTRRRRDQERARVALAAQYGKTLETWLQDCGGDALLFTAELLHAVQQQRDVRELHAAPVAVAAELNP